MTSKDLVDHAEMLRMLELLGKRPEDTRIRAFLHKKDPRKSLSEEKKKYLRGKADFNAGKISYWQEKCGLGVYLVVNDGGDSASEITSVRAFIAEWDGLTRDEQRKRLSNALSHGLLPPTFCVSTHPGDDASLHLYWVLDVPSDQILLWRFVQWSIIQILGSDPRVEDPSRVMRLAGCQYVRGLGVYSGRSELLPDLGSGDRVVLREMLESVRGVQSALGLNPVSAVPDSWLDSKREADLRKISDAIRPVYGAEISQALLSRPALHQPPANRSAAFADQLGSLGKEQDKKTLAYNYAIEHCNNEQDLRSALSFIPPREPGHNRYGTDRNILWGLVDACSRIDPPVEDPVELAVSLMDEHSPDAGWDTSQIAHSGNGAVRLRTFWFHAVEHGWRPTGDRWKTWSKDISQHQRANIDYAKIALGELVEQGASDVEIQNLITNYGANAFALRQYAVSLGQEKSRQDGNKDALEALFKKGVRPSIDIDEFLPASLSKHLYVLLNGLKIPPEAVVLTILAAIGGLLPPGIRVRAKSMSEPVNIWLLLVGSSGTAKSPLLKELVLKPLMKHVIPELDRVNDQTFKSWQAACEEGKRSAGPKPRNRHVLITSATKQGVEAQMASNGLTTPLLLVRDELAGWLKDMSSPVNGASDGEFYLSAYDESPSVSIFADEKLSRNNRGGKLSVIGGIQPEVLGECMPEGLGNGFFSRPLFVRLPGGRKELLDDPSPGVLENELGQLYKSLLHAVPTVDTFHGITPTSVFQLTPQAVNTFIDYFDQLESYRVDGISESVEALWSKAPGQLLRLAAALQVLRAHFKMDQGSNSEEDQLPRTSFSLAEKLEHRVAVTNATLQLAMKLLLVGKTTSEEEHRAVEDSQFAVTKRFLEVARKKQRSSDRPVSLRDIAKSGWSSKNRPPASELRQMARASHAQHLLEFDAEKNTVFVRELRSLPATKGSLLHPVTAQKHQTAISPKPLTAASDRKWPEGIPEPRNNEEFDITEGRSIYAGIDWWLRLWNKGLCGHDVLRAFGYPVPPP
jgi:hypothetical protein